jgi:biotin carboxyl carrier protein
VIYTYERGGQTYTIRLERGPDGRYRATIGETTYTFSAQPTPDGGWTLALEDGERVLVYGAAAGRERYVHAGGEHFTLTVPEARGGRRSGGGGAGDLTAQMPGQVVDVLVAEGETVTRGQTLVILEAMKMEIRAAAPADGRVKRLLVGKGDVVERGQHLVEFEAVEN